MYLHVLESYDVLRKQSVSYLQGKRQDNHYHLIS